MAKSRGLNTVTLDQYARNLERSDPAARLSPIDPVTELEVESLRPAPWNARRFFDQRSLELLGQDLKRNGQIHPIVVRTVGDGFEVVVGERRFRESQLVGLPRLRAHIRELDDQTARRIGLSENLEREDLNPYEETVGWLDLLALEFEAAPEFVAFIKPGEEPQVAAARVLRRFHNETFRANHNVMVQEAAEPVNHNVMVHDDRLVGGTVLEAIIVETFKNSIRMTWQSFVKNRLPILNLPVELLEVLYRGELEYTKAKELARIKDEVQRVEVLERVLTLNLPLTQIKTLVAGAITPKIAPNEAKLTTLASRTVKGLQRRFAKLSPAKQRRAEQLVAELASLLED